VFVERRHKRIVERSLDRGQGLRNDGRVAAVADPADPDGGEGPGWLLGVAADVGLVDRSSTAERVADVLRRRITEGGLPPRTRLSEDRLTGALHVSRNTLREAFRLLTHEGLLVHELHRGVFVRELHEVDLRDLYRLRHTIECGALRSLVDLEPARLQSLYDDVAASESAVRRGDWVSVGTANMRFHRDLVALADSPRTNEIAGRLLAELRLAFHAVASPRRLHEKYVDRNRRLLDLLAAGEYQKAAQELEVYLQDSLAELLDAVRSRRTEPGGR
jgi:DNA-binding GntR family transcriptional regulator